MLRSCASRARRSASWRRRYQPQLHHQPGHVRIAVYRNYFAVLDTEKVHALASDFSPRGGNGRRAGRHLHWAAVGPGEFHLGGHLVLADNPVLRPAAHVGKRGEPALQVRANRGLAVQMEPEIETGSLA